MTVTLTAFANSPDGGRGQARDMRVRWALEEVGQPYEVRLVTFDEMKQPAHLARQPFGQIPTYEEDGLVLFESAAIVHHIAGRYPGLLPEEPEARARAVMWMFAAVSTVEPPIVEHETALMFDPPPVKDQRMSMLVERIAVRLRQLDARLGDADWLEGGFSAADLVMVGVLRRLNSTDLLTPFPALSAYVARGEARPAFRRAYAAQAEVAARAKG